MDSKAQLTVDIIAKVAQGKIDIVDEFPMTVTGKIQKFKMREKTINEL